MYIYIYIFTETDNTQDSRRKKDHFYSSLSLPHPPTDKNSKTETFICSYASEMSITVHVFTRILLDEIYRPLSFIES